MHDYTLTHLSDAALLRNLAALVARDRLTTATLLAHIAEVDARRLYVPAGYPSMHAYCVDHLRLSEDAAYKRIRAARAARQFPILFDSVAEGRLHLAAVCLLAPHLTPENADGLIEAVTHRSRSEIEELLACHHTAPAVPARLFGVPPAPSLPTQLAPGRVGDDPSARSVPGDCLPLDELAPAQVDGTQVQAPPHNSERFLLQLTIAKNTRDKLRYAQALLSHAVPTGDVAQVLDRALDALIAQLERRKFGAVTRRSPRPRPTAGNGSAPGNTPAPRRHVPAQVRRAVWERDQGQCTYVSASGHRCKSRRFLEFDHVEPVARGGKATVDGMRLRCRAHNQYEAERMFGAAFMKRKRLEGRLAAARARTRAAAHEARTAGAAVSGARAVTESRTQAAQEQSQDVLTALRRLGCRATEARRAVELSGTLHGATLEERMWVALQHLGRT